MILGVNTSGSTAWLALVEDGVVAATPDRFQIGKQPRPIALRAALETVGNIMDSQKIQAVAIAEPQGNARVRRSSLDARELEVLIELAAAEREIPLRRVSPSTIASSLDLPTKAVDDHIDDKLKPAGAYWNRRGRAGLAALTVGKELE